ncbi:EamA family transporter [Wukongibacter baidiensis]|uniref:EamA family transporter n=1 Tax=Wukongibacter baidiensis TaxID=1723361 RepID=UPI003D7FE016
MNSENRRALFAYLAVCFFWGSTYLAIRIGVKDFPPFMFAGIRFIIAGGLTILYSKLKGNPFPNDKNDVAKISIVGLLMLLGGNGLVVYAEQWVHSGIASLLVATVPLFMAIIEIFVLRYKKMDYKGFVGLAVGFAGVAYLALGDSSAAIIDFTGTLLLLLASLSWSIGSVYSKTFKASGAIISNIGIQMFAGGLGLFTVGLLMGEISRAQFTKNSVLAMLYLIVFGSIIGYSCYIYVLAKWPASKAGTYAYVNPVVAVILGAVVLDEPFTLSVITSMLIIILGVFMVQRSKVEDVKEEVNEKV